MSRRAIPYLDTDRRGCRHNYMRQLEQMLARGELDLMPGEVVHVDIFHDDDCPALGGGVCDCSQPVVRVRGDARNN